LNGPGLNWGPQGNDNGQQAHGAKSRNCQSGQKTATAANLYLIVSNTASRKWVLRFTWRGRPKEMGLGSAVIVPLADAREKAAGARRRHRRAKTHGRHSHVWGSGERCEGIAIGRRIGCASNWWKKASSTASYIMVRLCVTQGAFSRKSPHASEWRLTFNTCDVTGELASKAFMRWGRDIKISRRGYQIRATVPHETTRKEPYGAFN
jgi:hypothetical protein